MLCMGQLAGGPPVAAFLAKKGRWNSHPDLTSLKIGAGTVVVLKDDGTAIRYTGEVWEYAFPQEYELQSHSGFLVDVGRWTGLGAKGVEVTFAKTLTEKNIML